MEPDAPLHHLIDGPADPAPGREELAAIVRRSGRRRTQVLVTGVTVALLVGVAGGWAVGRSGSGSSSHPVAVGAGAGARTSSGPASAGPAVAPAPGVAVAGATGGGSSSAVVSVGKLGGSMTKEFVRTTADGVSIRAYSISIPKSMSADGQVVCAPVFPSLNNEVSTTAVVGDTYGVQTSPSGALTDATTGVVGLGEGSPVWVVTARAGAGVAQVRMTFADGKTDGMAPVGGWVTLAHIAPPGSTSQPVVSSDLGVTGTLQALDPSGKVLGTVTLTDKTVEPLTPKCLPSPPASVPGGTGTVTPQTVTSGGAVIGSASGSGFSTSGGALIGGASGSGSVSTGGAVDVPATSAAPSTGPAAP